MIDQKLQNSPGIPNMNHGWLASKLLGLLFCSDPQYTVCSDVFKDACYKIDCLSRFQLFKKKKTENNQTKYAFSQV